MDFFFVDWVEILYFLNFGCFDLFESVVLFFNQLHFFQLILSKRILRLIFDFLIEGNLLQRNKTLGREQVALIQLLTKRLNLLLSIDKSARLIINLILNGFRILKHSFKSELIQMRTRNSHKLWTLPSNLYQQILPIPLKLLMLELKIILFPSQLMKPIHIKLKIQHKIPV